MRYFAKKLSRKRYIDPGLSILELRTSRRVRVISKINYSKRRNIKCKNGLLIRYGEDSPCSLVVIDAELEDEFKPYKTFRETE